MHQTLLSDDIESQINSEICIIGAGAAGISMAIELDKSNHSVLLLESGGLAYDTDIQSLNFGYNIGQPYLPIEATRLRYFGGTTNHWTGQCSTLDAIDFEEREWINNSGWPIRKVDLDPYYKKAHKICDLQAYEYDLNYWENRLGKSAINFNKNFVRTKIYQKSAPTRFGAKYQEQIVSSKNVRLITEANLTHISLNEYGKQVDHLVISTLSGKKHVVKSKFFILACGSLQNARHLLNSNSVVNRGIGNENDLVGRFFMEHPHVDTANMTLLSKVKMNMYYDSSLNSKVFGMFATSDSIQRKLKLQNYSARIENYESTGNPAEAKIDPAIMIKDWENRDNKIADVNKFRRLLGDRSVDWLLDKYLSEKLQPKSQESNKLETYKCVFNTRGEQAPNRDSRVSLANTKDAIGIPHIKLNWQLTESDKISLLKSNIVIGQELGRLGIGRLKISDWLFENEKLWPEFLTGGFHHMGVTRMSRNPLKGVVDENCKIHSVNNLYVASSSVFPTSGVANPTLTIIALSLRLVDHLKKMK